MATATKRSTAAKKGARTRATAARKRTPAAAPTSTLDRVGGVAERAVLTSVGAALTARDSIVGTVRSRAKAERQLRRFERRGTTARAALERELEQGRAKAGHALETGALAGAQVVAKVTERIL